MAVWSSRIRTRCRHNPSNHVGGADPDDHCLWYRSPEKLALVRVGCDYASAGLRGSDYVLALALRPAKRISGEPPATTWYYRHSLLDRKRHVLHSCLGVFLYSAASLLFIPPRCLDRGCY